MNGQPDGNQADGRNGSRIGAGIAIGAGFGVALGLVLDNLALGIAIGAAMGTAIGASLEGRKARSAWDQVASSRAGLSTLLGLGLLLLLVATGVALLVLFAAR
jgi:hypothetical protein